MTQINDVADKEWGGDSNGEFITEPALNEGIDRNVERKSCTFCYFCTHEQGAWICNLKGLQYHEFSFRDCEKFWPLLDKLDDNRCNEADMAELRDDLFTSGHNTSDEYAEINQVILDEIDTEHA